jgi:hypothetical protein
VVWALIDMSCTRAAPIVPGFDPWHIRIPAAIDLLLGQRNGFTNGVTRFALVQHALHTCYARHGLDRHVRGHCMWASLPAERGVLQITVQDHSAVQSYRASILARLVRFRPPDFFKKEPWMLLSGGRSWGVVMLVVVHGSRPFDYRRSTRDSNGLGR